MSFSDTCPDCGTPVGQPHNNECDVERCSICGTQRISCECEGHDPAKSVWTGEWPTPNSRPHASFKAKMDKVIGMESTLGRCGELIYKSPTGCPLAVIDPEDDDVLSIGQPVSLQHDWLKANVGTMQGRRPDANAP